jgi:hypothetical protein
MRHLYIILLILIQFLFIDCRSKSQKIAPKAVNGVLDLTTVTWDFKEDGILNLEGEWDFFWSRFLEPKDFLLDKLPCSLHHPHCSRNVEWKRNQLRNCNRGRICHLSSYNSNSCLLK